MRSAFPYFLPLISFALIACAEKKEEPDSIQEPAVAEAPPEEPATEPEDEPVDDEVAAEAPEEETGEAEAGEDQSELDCEAEGVECPLYAFQVANAQTAVENNDVEAVAKVLHQIEFFAPDASWNEGPNGWAQIARRGAVAAEAGEMREARKACRECHRQYPNEDMPFRKMYETQGHRTRALPELPENAETTGMPGIEVEAG